jgi:hypothetical protein
MSVQVIVHADGATAKKFHDFEQAPQVHFGVSHGFFALLVHLGFAPFPSHGLFFVPHGLLGRHLAPKLFQAKTRLFVRQFRGVQPVRKPNASLPGKRFWKALKVDPDL